jgi:mRNA deadenylase 3'-5' endonuclease subunit Ccr4
MTGPLSHALCLSSAYPDTTPFTNFTSDFKGCLDYIFAGPTLQLAGVEPLLTEEEAKRHTALPSPVWPSDHLLLAATYTFPLS